MTLADIIGGSIGDLFSKVVGTFKLSPEKAAELETKKMECSSELQKLQMEYDGKVQDAVSREIEAASANIRAESITGDKYTGRARPTFLYVCEFILLWNYVGTRCFGITPIELPASLFWLFGSVMLGYTGARSWEKFMGLPGESTLQLGSWIKAANNSPTREGK